MSVNNESAVCEEKFTREDRTNAIAAWCIYMGSINGCGLRWVFDKLPSNTDMFFSVGPDQLGSSEQFQYALDQLQDMIDKLETFKGRPVTQPHPFAWQDNLPDTITRRVTEEEISVYRKMHAAFSAYKTAAETYGKNSSEARCAAHWAFYAVNPEPWRRYGAPIAPGTKSYIEFGTRWYLEAVACTEDG